MNKKIIFIFSALLYNLIQQENKRKISDECMIKSISNNIVNKVLFNVSDKIKDYNPPGCLDGLGACLINNNNIRIFCNHEISKGHGLEYTLNNKKLRGARISYFDMCLGVMRRSLGKCEMRDIRSGYRSAELAQLGQLSDKSRIDPDNLIVPWDELFQHSD